MNRTESKSFVSHPKIERKSATMIRTIQKSINDIILHPSLRCGNLFLKLVPSGSKGSKGEEVLYD